MASLSHAPRLGDLSSPHGTFQEHAAHLAKWPAMLSSKGSQGTCIPRGLATFLPCACTAHIDHPIGRVPDAPYPHLTLTVRTDARGSTGALLIPLPVGQPGDALHGALDDAFHLGQGGLHHALHLGKRLGGLPPIIPNALEPFGHRVWHHAADTGVYLHGVVLHPLGAVGAVMGRAPVAIIVINPPDGD